MARKPDKNQPKRPVGAIVAGVVAVLLAGGVYWLSQNIAGVSRGPEQAPNVNLLPPPPPAPPPPPPPPEKQVPPDKQIEPPKNDEPKQADQPKQLTIAGPAQAGGDAFGIKAGSGGGSSIIGGPSETGGATGGGGFAEAAYSRYLGTEMQRAIQADDKLSRQVFAADVAVWFDAAGRLTKAKILRSSGDSRLDQQLVATLEGMRAIGDPPPPAFRFPQKVTVRGRRG
jgi:TonB family protein